MILGLLFIYPPVPLQTYITVPVVEAAEVSNIDYGLLVYKAAVKYGVNESHLYKTLYWESNGFIDPKIQSQCLEKDGTQEKSYGVCQIHLPDHPEVSYEQAIDPYWCIDWTAKQWSLDLYQQWHAYQFLADRNWVIPS